MAQGLMDGAEASKVGPVYGVSSDELKPQQLNDH